MLGCDVEKSVGQREIRVRRITQENESVLAGFQRVELFLQHSK